MKDSKINELKKNILETAHRIDEGHIASAFSILDILWVLYDRILYIDPKDLSSEHRDRFILSKGHASLGLYVVLAEKLFFDKEVLESFGTYNSKLGGHPDRNKVAGVEASTGSLGHGMPIAVGIALGLKIKKNSARVFTLIGDGEANEGTIWESALLASHHGLSQLYCIIDHNHSTDRAVGVDSLKNKFQSFGWNVYEIDGHSHEEIYEVLSQKNMSTKPTAIVAHTTKGKGLKSMENNPEWHHRTPNSDELIDFMKELHI